MKVKVKELEGTALDWSVAKAEGVNAGIKYGVVQRPLTPDEKSDLGLHSEADAYQRYNYLENWALAGPIIEREFIALGYGPNDGWIGMDMNGNYYMGPTPLVAAMRCYVISKLGFEIDIPEELL